MFIDLEPHFVIDVAILPGSQLRGRGKITSLMTKWICESIRLGVAQGWPEKLSFLNISSLQNYFQVVQQIFESSLRHVKIVYMYVHLMTFWHFSTKFSVKIGKLISARQRRVPKLTAGHLGASRCPALLGIRKAKISKAKYFSGYLAVNFRLRCCTCAFWICIKASQPATVTDADCGCGTCGCILPSWYPLKVKDLKLGLTHHQIKEATLTNHDISI